MVIDQSLDGLMSRLDSQFEAKRSEECRGKRMVWNEAKRTSCDEFIRAIGAHFKITGIAVNGVSWGRVDEEDRQWTEDRA